MPEELTDEQKKARRAEINRENAQKSTGPTTETGKMKVRLNGLRNGARSSVIDMSALESLVLLPWEGPEAYKAVVADYTDKLQPRDQVEIGVCQKIADTQWRLMRLNLNERTFNEECMIKAGQLAHPGVPENRVLTLDCLNGFQIAADSKLLKEFRREEAAPQRSLNASYREYTMLRKLDPRPKTPLTQNARIIGQSQAPGPLEQMSEESVNLQPADLIDPSAMPVDDQSQVQTDAGTPQDEVPAPAPLETIAEESANPQTVSAVPEIKPQTREMTFAAGAEGHGLPLT